MNHILKGILVFAGACAALGCQSGVITVPPLATGQLNVSGLGSDGNNVFWTTAEGFVRSVSTSGGAVQTLTQGPISPGNLTFDADMLYWTANGTINGLPKAGGTAAVLFPNEDGIGSLQVDPTSLYWLRNVDEVQGQGQVRKADKTVDASVTVLASANLNPQTLALNGASLYFPATVLAEDSVTAAPALTTLPTTGGTPVASVTGSFANVATYGANVCSAGTDMAALSLDPTSGAQAITCTALDGSNPNVVAAGLTGIVTSLTLDDTTVYFSTDDGAVSVVNLDGTAPIVTGATTSPDTTTLIGANSSGSTGPVVFAQGPAGSASVALDATQVYWAHTNGNAVFALPKF